MFNINSYPAAAREWFAKEPILWPAALDAAIEGGVTDRDDLTDLVFFMHHKERLQSGRGQPLRAGEPNFDALAAEWKGFATLVRRRTASTKKPGGSSSSSSSRFVRPAGIRTVGAYCGFSTLANPERDVDFAVEHNIDRLDVMVNDFAKARSPQPFKMRSVRQIETLAGRAADNGIEIHLVSWLMPHADFIDEAARQLVPVCESVGAASVQWDAEEPWTQARRRLSYTDAADRVADRFAGRDFEMGVTAIGFAPADKLRPLADVCDYTLPQAYSTRNQLTPGKGQRQLHRRYETKFGRPIVMGLAAYRQSGIKGHTIRSAMATCLEATADLGCDTAVYWSLRHIRARGAQEHRKFFRSLGASAPATVRP